MPVAVVIVTAVLLWLMNRRMVGVEADYINTILEAGPPSPNGGEEPDRESVSCRASPYIDFDSGTVKIQPMDLSRERPPPHSLDDMLDLFQCRVDV